MTFDPYADMIDLRDVIEEAGEGGTASAECRAFLKALVTDLGYPSNGRLEIADSAQQIADDEPTVIARRYFVEYAQDLANETEALHSSGTAPWPFYCIDWTYAAKELEMDYSSFTYDGREYLIRSV